MSTQYHFFNNVSHCLAYLHSYINKLVVDFLQRAVSFMDIILGTLAPCVVILSSKFYGNNSQYASGISSLENSFFAVCQVMEKASMQQVKKHEDQ